MLDSRIADDSRIDWQGPLRESATVGEALDLLGTPDNRTLVESTISSTKRMTDHQEDNHHNGGWLSKIKLRSGCRVSSTYNYYSNDYIYIYL